MLDRLQKIAQLIRIKHRLRDRILRTGFNLTFEATDLLFGINRAWINADADAERGRLTNGIVSDVESMVQFVDHVRQADGVDIETRPSRRDMVPSSAGRR